MLFEWDRRKAAGNQKKHGVQFSEAATVFGDPLTLTFPDPDHSLEEERFITVGVSQNGHILLVSHADRGETIRIISVRHATRSERNYYEEHKN